MKTYCDTNILTAFLNKDDIIEKFGKKEYQKYKKVKGFRSIGAQNKLDNVDKCIIDKKFLASDLNGHNASMGAVLTSMGVKDITLVDLNGEKTGRKFFNMACKKTSKQSGFYKRFCERGKLKDNLRRNEVNDIGHFGSAIESKSQVFLTDNLRDFKPLKNFTKMEVE